MTEAHRAYITTFSGIQVPIRAVEPSMVRIEDIAHSLSNQARFLGHTREPYSIAQHSVLVARMIRECGAYDKIEPLLGLLHDAGEAYTGDFPLPIKVNVPGLMEFDRGVEQTVRAALAIDGYPKYYWATVKMYDTIALHVEAFNLFNQPPEWADPTIARTYDEYRPAKCWKPRKAERKFLAAYEELRHGSN